MGSRGHPGPLSLKLIGVGKKKECRGTGVNSVRFTKCSGVGERTSERKISRQQAIRRGAAGRVIRWGRYSESTGKNVYEKGSTAGTLAGVREVTDRGGGKWEKVLGRESSH